jgi:hypothetical protein
MIDLDGMDHAFLAPEVKGECLNLISKLQLGSIESCVGGMHLHMAILVPSDQGISIARQACGCDLVALA